MEEERVWPYVLPFPVEPEKRRLIWSILQSRVGMSLLMKLKVEDRTYQQDLIQGTPYSNTTRRKWLILKGCDLIFIVKYKWEGIMEKESKRELLSRLLMIIGGAITLIFGLLTAFIPGLAYVKVWVFNPFITTPAVVRFSFDFQIHSFTFGLLVSSVGGLLGLTASLMRVNRGTYLGFTGDFLGFLGFAFFRYPEYPSMFEADFLYVFWVGVCLTLIGVSLMFIGSMVKSRGWHRLTLLGVPLILASLLMYPFLIIANNLHLFVSIYRNMSINVSIVYLMILGFALTLSGTVIGIWKFHGDLKRVIQASG